MVRKEITKKTEIPTMISLREASEITGLTYILIKKMCDEGKVSYIKSGKKYLVNFQSLLKLLQDGEGGNKGYVGGNGQGI